MNLSIVPLRVEIAVEASSRYSLQHRHDCVAEPLRKPGEAHNIGKEDGQDLLTATWASLDAARHQGANERRWNVFLKRREAAAHLRQRGGKIVELA